MVGCAPLVLLPAWRLGVVLSYVGVMISLHISGVLQLIYVRILVPLGERNLDERFEFIRRGSRSIQDAPILGHGVGNIGRVLETAIHNAYIQAAGDIGLIGAAAFTTLVAYLIFRIGQIQGSRVLWV